MVFDTLLFLAIVPVILAPICIHISFLTCQNDMQFLNVLLCTYVAFEEHLSCGS